MNETTYTFRVDEALKADFSDAAKRRDRNGAQLLREFMRDFVRHQHETADYDTWFRTQVRAGVDSAEAGRLLPSAEVEAHFAAKRAATRQRVHGAPE